MVNENEIKEIVANILFNLYYYTDVSIDTLKQKDNEFSKYSTATLAKEISTTRPYPGVIQSMRIDNTNYSDVKNEQGNQYSVTVSFDLITIVNKNMGVENSNVAFNVKFTLEYDNMNWILVGIEELTDVKETPYEEDLYFDILDTTEIIAQKYVDTLDEHKNIKYMFKGQPKENPFKTDKDVYIDTYNLVYWLFKEEDIKLDYPLNANYFLTNGTFYTIFGKGHKYQVDIGKFEQGDILFFGRSDDNIGLYVGNGDFISMMGQFPKDETPISIYKLEDYWDDFNGRVMRFDEEGYDTW